MIKTVQAAALRMSQQEVVEREVIGSWKKLLDYCRMAMAEEKTEQFRLLFLDNKNALIADEVQQRGTVNHTPVYPREVVKRALELGATAIIMVHNHPSGDPTPSADDIAMTREVAEAARQTRHRPPRPHRDRPQGPCQPEEPGVDLSGVHGTGVQPLSRRHASTSALRYS